MSGKAGGVQKCFQDIVTSNQVNRDNACAPFVHCSTHNLKLVINDAAEATVEGIKFFVSLLKCSIFLGVLLIVGLNKVSQKMN